MRRREVIAFLVGAVAWPCVVGAQDRKRVGILLQGGPYYVGIEGLREGLKASGLEEGRELAFLVRDAAGDLTAVEAAARALEREGVDVSPATDLQRAASA
jgi:putative tryptophan/tyrosine transport system substrate-binding protein